MRENIQHSTFNVQRRRIAHFALVRRWKLNVECSMFLLALLILLAGLPLHAQTNSAGTNTLPALVPPYGELPPTAWEQHGTFIVIGGLGIVALAALGCWLIFRPEVKRMVPPEVAARRELELLRQRPEDGAVLSRVSQVMRSYFSAAFQLARGELTTTEFCREISGNEKIGAELALAAADFLRDCDGRKFSPVNKLVPLGAANQALDLVERAEKRLAQQCQPAAAQTLGRRP